MTRSPKTTDASPEVSFSPQALQALLEEVTAGRKLIADTMAALTEQKAELDALKTKVADQPVRLSVAGKSERSDRCGSGLQGQGLRQCHAACRCENLQQVDA